MPDYATRAPARRALLALALGAAIFAASTSDDDYDPTAEARASIGRTKNYEAVIPPQCYTKTAGVANPCWTCHVDSEYPNVMDDWSLQEEYAFSGFALTNRWSNLFVDRTEKMRAIADDDVLAWIRADNYAPLRRAMRRVEDYPGYRPDFDLHRGVDAEGFAADGSHWRAVRFKPFPGTFWPTNGAANDVYIRLPEAFRTTADGTPSRAVYKVNLAILEASMASPPKAYGRPMARTVEPIDEALAGADLDGNGAIGGTITTIRTLPPHYAGGAAGIRVERLLYPTGVEFLHTVRYLDPDVATLHARRLKELRYARKTRSLDTWGILHTYENEVENKERGKLPHFAGTPLVGMLNEFGWQLQGFIEDRVGRLRVQTEEETYSCLGCHTNLGVTVDQTFSFPRKLPGAAGWRHQDLRGIQDAPQVGHAQPEILTYFERVTGGDGFRANTEILERFFPNGRLDKARVRRAAIGGEDDITALVYPSRARALDLNRASMLLVREQAFRFGRDPMLAPPENVHPTIENEATDLSRTGRVFRDGRAWLDWTPRAP